jgi:hypothetical protein
MYQGLSPSYIPRVLQVVSRGQSSDYSGGVGCLILTEVNTVLAGRDSVIRPTVLEELMANSDRPGFISVSQVIGECRVSSPLGPQVNIVIGRRNMALQSRPPVTLLTEGA